MNIAIFSDTYYPQINGVATSIMMLEKELINRGHKVYIFTPNDPNVVSDPPNIFRLPSVGLKFLPSNRLAMVYPPNLLLKLKYLKLDLIHTQTEFPLGIIGKTLSEVLRVPLVHTYHTMYEDYVHYIAKGHLITPKMAQQYSKLFCNSAKAVIAPVEKTKESLLEYGVERPIAVIPTGIDFEPFSRNKYSKEDINNVRAEFGLSPEEPVIVSIGRIAKEKSLDIVLKAMPEVIKRMPNIKFLIVGNGPYKDELEQMSHDLGVDKSVIFAGSRPWSMIGKYYQAGNVFVTASTSETQGLTYIEAMAAKVPVIAKKDRSAEGVIINNETGFYFEEDSELPDLLCKVFEKNTELEKISEKAFDNIQHLSSKHFAESVEKLYLETINAYPPKNRRKLTVIRKFKLN